MDFFKIETEIQEEAIKEKYYTFQHDKLKSNKYVYTSFPLVHKNSIEINDLRSYVYADAYSRFLTYKENNVLFTTGINNTSKKIYDSVLGNVLSKDDPYTNLKSKSYADLKQLDLIMDVERTNESHSKKFIYFIQDAFLKLHKFGHIIEEDENFYLSFESVKEEVVEEIKKASKFDELKEFLNYKVGISLNIKTTCETEIEIVIENPHFLGATSFIAIKPSVAARAYYLESETDFIKDYIKNKKGLGVFSGNFAINPLTSEYIPIIISHYFSDQVHIGQACINEKDLLFTSYFQFEYKEILSKEKTLINSHLLDDLTVTDARDKVVEYLVSKYNAQTTISYETKLLISTQFHDGIAIPFYEREVMSKEELPVLINSKNEVRTLNSKLPSKKTTDKVFTTNITSAFLSLASRAKDSTGITSYSSVNFIFEMKDFPKCDYAIFHSNADYFFTLVLNMIVFKSLNMEYTGLFERFYILPEIADTNNMIEINAVLTKFGSCSLRLDMLNMNLSENYYYNVDKVIICKNNVQKILNIFDYDIVSDFKELDHGFSNLMRTTNDLIMLNDFPTALELFFDFVEKIHEYKKITSRQAKGVLLLFSLIAPSLAQNIYKTKFKKTYPLMFEAWPTLI